MKTRLLAIGILLFLSFAASEGRVSAARPARPPSAKKFDALANAALAAMKSRAAALNVAGVAVVAYAPGASIQSWISKMSVVGRMKDPAGKGSNLLGIAYAKASEMADTLQNSGTSGRVPLIGEFGWQGGVIARGRSGYIIVAFSGGKSEDDVQISRSGLATLQSSL